MSPSAPERAGAATIGAAGIPALICGPEDMVRGGHKADEWIGLDELAAASRMMDRLTAAIRPERNG